MRIPQQVIENFQTKILNWYTEHQRDLPWRKSRDPYRILVSEIMLQQTQVSRVIPKYQNWLKAFPTVHALATAKVSDVLEHWSGLGYNRRALNLKKTAEIVTQQYNGKFPSTEKELLALPGIGMYTARAVMCFAFDEQVAVVDINVKKVILTQLSKDLDSQGLRLGDSERSMHEDPLNDKEIALIADQLLPHGKAYEWNQALMDYSSIVLKKEKVAIPKQSTFIGSRRYYRGQVLKVLLMQKEMTVEDLGKIVKIDFAKDDNLWWEKLLNEMQKEGFIKITNNKIMLS